MEDSCVFGCLRPDIFWFNTVANGLICGIFGTAGALFLVKYYPRVLLQNYLLLRPFISQGIGIYLGIDKVPGIMTLIGLLGILMSIVLLRIGNKLRNEIS